MSYDYNSSNHWQECLYCSYSSSTSAHGSWTSGGSSGCKCGTCGYVTSGHKAKYLDYTGSYEDWTYDEDYHRHYYYIRCSTCSYKSSANSTLHTYSYSSNSNGTHTRTCSGNANNSGNGGFTCNISNSESCSGYYSGSWVYYSSSYHSKTCSKCSYKNTASHSYSANGDVTPTYANSGYHYLVQECSSCGHTKNGTRKTCTYATIDGYVYDDTAHYKGECVCGNRSSYGTHSKSYQYDGINNTYHWSYQECSICGWTSSQTRQKHVLDGGNSYAGAPCYYCGFATDRNGNFVALFSPNPTEDVDKIEIEGFVTVKPPTKSSGDRDGGDSDDDDS